MAVAAVVATSVALAASYQLRRSIFIFKKSGAADRAAIEEAGAITDFPGPSRMVESTAVLFP